MSEPAIVCDALTRDFGSLRAVNALSLEVAAGSIFAFLGANGAGKTTTIHLLLGILEPTAGRASVLGVDPARNGQAVRSRCGALLEHHGLYERLTAVDNLAFYARVWKMSVADRERRIEELLTHFGLWERRHERISTWSRGMKQKLAISRVLLHRPEVVFLDEPTAGLDPESAVALRSDITTLARRENVTVFLNTHNLTDAEVMSDRVGVIRRGELLAIGKPSELRAKFGATRVVVRGHGFTEELVRAVRGSESVADATLDDGHLTIRTHGETSMAPIVRQLVLGGVGIEEVLHERSNLEEVFIKLVQESR